MLNKLKPIPWRGVHASEKLILVMLPLLAIAVMALPFLDQVILRRLARLPGMRPVITWLINGPNVWIVGAGLLLLFALFVAFVRHRLVSNKRLWFGTGCPQCMERDLVRVSRQAGDRSYGLIGVPAYRYACRNCTWRGLRIARREHSPEREAELEASLMRFDPDSAPLNWPAESISEPVVENKTILVDGGQEQATKAEFGAGDNQPLNMTPDTVISEEEGELTNHHADPESLDETEWLWRRISD